MKIHGVYLRGKTYWFRGVVNGRLVQQSLKTSNKAEAAAAAEKVKNTEWALATVRAEEDASSEKAVDDFIAYKKSRGIVQGRLNQLERTCNRALRLMGCDPAESPGKVTHSTARAWTNSYPNLTTRRCMFHDLQMFYRWLIKEKRLRSSPFEGIELPGQMPRPARKRFLTPEQAEKVIATPCGEDLRFALFCMMHAGLRYGEVCAARPEWFDLKAGLLHIAASHGWRTKNKVDRSIPLTGRFREFLSSYGLKEPFMLRPEKKQAAQINRVDLRKSFTNHMKACGVTCTYHDLRRTFASLHVSAGTPIYIVAKWLGDTIKVTEEHYAHLHHSGDDIERAWK